MMSPAALPAGRDAWSFRLPQSNAVMSYALIEHMKKKGIKTIGFLGYTDAYGEGWLNDFKAESAKSGGPQIVAVERFARPDTSVTAQALKLVAANPPASSSSLGMVLPCAKGDRAWLQGTITRPRRSSRDLLRIGGKTSKALRVRAPRLHGAIALQPPLEKLALDFVPSTRRPMARAAATSSVPTV